jgi:hypothetical protein
MKGTNKKIASDRAILVVFFVLFVAFIGILVWGVAKKNRQPEAFANNPKTFNVVYASAPIRPAKRGEASCSWCTAFDPEWTKFVQLANAARNITTEKMNLDQRRQNMSQWITGPGIYIYSNRQTAVSSNPKYSGGKTANEIMNFIKSL